MSVQNSQPANETTFNTSFMSREEDTNTIGRVDLDNALAESGPTVANMQRELNGQASFVGDTPEGAYDRKPTWASDSIGTPNQAVKDRVDSIQGAVETNQTAISELETDVTDIRSALGIVDGDTDMGTYTGSTISDNVDQTTINQELETAVEARIPLSEKGAPNGVATLDSGGRLPPAQLPTSAVEYKGAWNASTNTPTLIDGVGDNGDLYRVSVAGTQDLGSGSVSYGVGDAIIYNGTIWQRIPADDAVTSVNGQSGIVVLDTDDVAEGATNLYHTDARVDARIALASIDDLADVDTTTVPPNLNEALVWDGTNWVPGQAVGGSGQGKKNYFEGGDFEQDIALASVYDDGGSFVDGTGGTPSAITISQNSTGPLAGGFDLQIYKTTVSGIGEGVTLLSSNIDLIDLGKDLFLELSIDATDTNYTSGNYILNAYDVTNSAIIPIVPIANLGDNGEILKAQTTIYAKVLCNSNTQQVRVSLHCNADPVPGNDFFVFVDQAVLSPASVLVGSVITEWQSYTPSGSWSSFGTYTGRYRRVGDSMEIEASWLFSSTPSGNFDISLPSGFTIDTTKVAQPNTNAEGSILGFAKAFDAGVGSHVGVVTYTSTTTVRVQGDDGSSLWTPTVPITFAAGEAINVNFKVPISQWSSGNLLSANEVANKTVKARAYRGGSGQSVSGTTDATVILNTIDYDPFNIFNTSTGLATIPVSGKYLIIASIYATGVTTTDTMIAAIRKNGTTIAQNFAISVASDKMIQVSTVADLTRGQTIGAYINVSSDITYTIVNNQTTTYLEIVQLPDFTTFGTYSESGEVRSATSAEKTPVGSNHYHQLTGNSVTLPVGDWRISGSALFINSGVTPTYSIVAAGFYASNGADTSSVPSSLTTIPGLTQLNSVPTQLGLYLENGGGMANAGATIPMRIIRLSQPATIFVVTFSTQTTSANARLYASITAERIT